MIQGISVSVSHMQFHLLIKVHGGGAHMPSRRAIKTHPAQGTRTTFTPGMRGVYIYIPVKTVTAQHVCTPAHRAPDC